MFDLIFNKDNSFFFENKLAFSRGAPIGLKTVPCGTPESTSTRLEDTPSTTTHCLHIFREN